MEKNMENKMEAGIAWRRESTVADRRLRGRVPVGGFRV